MDPIDLRSDTVTRPSPAMRSAMLEAEVGDDVLGDDPTVIALQEYAAELLGKEAGLFFPSGTMCNQAALRALTRRGDEVFLHAQAHIIFYEQGAAAALSQLQLRVFDSPDGTLDLEKMDEYVHTDADVHWAPTRLVCLEQTHNHCGGVVLPLEHILAVRELCDRHGLAMHLDGARLFNASAASGVGAAEYAAPFDTVSICLSKGLGAPVGSVLVGDAATLRQAARARKIYGGGMRQAGIVAAAGLHALRAQRRRGSPTTTAARAASPRGWRRSPASTSTSRRCRRTWCSPGPAGRGCRPPRSSSGSPPTACCVSTRRPGRCASSRTWTSTTTVSRRRSPASPPSSPPADGRPGRWSRVRRPRP